MISVYLTKTKKFCAFPACLSTASVVSKCSLIASMIKFLLGNLSTAVEINLPTSGCGIRSDLNSDGSMEMSVRLVIQMDEKLRQRSDLERLVRCTLPDQMMEMHIGESTEEKSIVRLET